MRAIVKGPEPPSLTAYRLAPHGGYEDYPDKDALQRSLSAEQRGLCCYCMGRIRPDADSMKIEHWRSQARYPDEQLSYRNLLGACRGGEGQPRGRQHCDRDRYTAIAGELAPYCQVAVWWLQQGIARTS